MTAMTPKSAAQRQTKRGRSCSNAVCSQSFTLVLACLLLSLLQSDTSHLFVDASNPAYPRLSPSSFVKSIRKSVRSLFGKETDDVTIKSTAIVTAKTTTNTVAVTTTTSPSSSSTATATVSSKSTAHVDIQPKTEQTIRATSADPTTRSKDSHPVTGKVSRSGSERKAGSATVRFNTSSAEDETDPQLAYKNHHNQHKRSRFSLKERQARFLDRLTLLTSPLLWPLDAPLDTTIQESDEAVDWDAITLQSDLTRPGRHVHIVTTAALPWFTGTAVNPLLRAAYLHRRLHAINNPIVVSNQTTNNIDVQLNDDTLLHFTNNSTTKSETGTEAGEAASSSPSSWVTLVIPWLELAEDQTQVYGQIYTQEQQEAYIRNWLRSADLEDVADALDIVFYPARYHAGMGSVFAMGDIIKLLDPNRRDVCILEEPEHCNWYRAPSEGWTQQFQYVVGIVHTNYKEYASQEYHGLWTAPALALMSSAMVRAYCHKVIKLSDALQTYAPEKETSSNVHGVRSSFLQEGARRAQNGWNATVESINGVGKPSASQQHTSMSTSKAQIYFVGKLLWAKGLNLLLELEDTYKDYTGEYFEVDIYGSGPDQSDIQRAFLGRKQLSRDKIQQSISLSDSVLQDLVSLGDIEGDEDEDSDEESDDEDEDEEEQIENEGSNVDKSADQHAAVAEILHEAVKIENVIVQTNQDVDLVEVEEETHFVKLHKKAKHQISKVKKSIPKTFAELRRQPIPATFPGRVDHAELREYKIFINPSITEVLCTTTAEAVAMGKFVIIPVHPSNTFFLQFPNCLAYRNKLEALANIRWALDHDPEPLSHNHWRALTWEAATDRLIDASAITRREAFNRERLGRSKLDERIAWLHKEIGKGTAGDVLRALFGAGPASKQVQYELQRLQQDPKQKIKRSGGDDDGDGDSSSSSSEDEDDGLSSKFRKSSFANALRQTAEDLLTFMQQRDI
jgi:digalactosyldiacylglycerol synthase